MTLSRPLLALAAALCLAPGAALGAPALSDPALSPSAWSASAGAGGL